jgi:hypothetical protein
MDYRTMDIGLRNIGRRFFSGSAETVPLVVLRKYLVKSIRHSAKNNSFRSLFPPNYGNVILWTMDYGLWTMDDGRWDYGI